MAYAKMPRNIPGRKGYPIVGNFLDFTRNVSNMKDILVLMKDYIKDFDEYGIAKLWFGPLLLVAVWDLDMVEAALTVNNKGHIFNIIFGEIADGMFISDALISVFENICFNCTQLTYPWLQLHKYQVIDERRRRQKENKDEDKCYLDSVLKREHEKGIPREILWKDLCDLLTVSSDTSSSTVNAALVFMAMFPDIQEKVYQEQMSIFCDSSRDPTSEDLAAMNYLRMVVKETLRHVAPPATFRTFDRDVSVGKYVIPKGAIGYTFFYKIHHNPKFWERVDDFYPEHFLQEKEAARPPRAFVPFGSGKRACPGAVYGMNSIMVILSIFIRTFKLSTSLNYKDIIYDYQLLLRICNGYNVKFEERKNTQD